MSTRTRRRQPQPEEEEEEDDDQQLTDSVSLEFDESLSWRAGKPIGVNILAQRLERLSKELMDLDQEVVDSSSLNKVAKDLASHNLLQHKDRGIKALTAACLVDILRVCAPTAPFTEAQLKDIFTLFIRHIIPSLQDVNASYQTHHKHVLASLAEVKSILLLNDIEQADDLLVQLFTVLFDTVSSPKAAAEGVNVRDLEFNATELLVCIVDEGNGVPAQVVDVVMAQFLRAAQSRRDKADNDDGQSTLDYKDVPAAYSMATAICSRCVEKMARYVGQYFADVIYEASGLGSKSNGHRVHADADDEDVATGPSDDDLKELRKAHLLVRELWRACPLVMANVVPQLEQELNADNVQIRQLATETIGDIIAGIGAAGPPPAPTLDPLAYPPLRLSDEVSTPESNVLSRPMATQAFSQAYGIVFRSFITRRNDKTATIRAAWTKAIGYILSTKAGGTGLTSHDQTDMVKYLGEKLNDTDEKVRLAGVQAIETFSFQDIVMILAPSGGVDKKDSVLSSLADRARDKKPAVRVEATILLAKLWAVAGGELAAREEAVIAAFSGIPSRVFKAYYANDRELNVLLDRVIFEYLIPLGFPPAPSKSKAKQANGSSQNQAAFDQDRIRAERVLLLVRSLDEMAKKALHAMHSRQPQFSKVMLTFVSHCEAFNSGVMDGNAEKIKSHLNQTINYIAQFLPEPEKATADLKKFAKANDRRSYQLIKFAVSIESDFKTSYRAIKELVKRNTPGGGGNSHAVGILDILLPLLYRSSCLIFNRSYLATFMDHSRNDENGFGSTAHEILNEVSSKNPDLFKTHVGALRKDLEENVPSPDDTEPNPGVVESLKAYSSYSRKYPDDVPQDRKFVQALFKHAMYGPAKGAKLVVNILLAKKNDKSMTNATELLQQVMADWNYGSSFFLNKLTAVAQLEFLAPKVALDAEDEILDMTLKQILFKNRTDAPEGDPTFVDDLAQSDEEIQAKVLALKINVNRILGITNLEEAKEKGAPVFKLLRNILNKSGDLSKKDAERPTPNYHQARLRLTAAQLYLKLCTNHTFDDLLNPSEFNLIAFTAQDPQPMVRRGFVEKLQKYLSLNNLKTRFYTMLFLTAFEPNRELKQNVETWIRSRARFFQHKDSRVMESVMGRLISLLAHHPDFIPESADDLLDHAKYLIYYISLVATEENIGMLYGYAERAKQTKDAIDPEKSENVYMVCDLATAVIRKWQEKKNWVFTAYSGKIGLPKGLYAGLASHSAAQEISEKQFIPDGVEESIDELLTKQFRKKRKSVEDGGAHPPAKRVKTGESKAKSSKAARQKEKKAKKVKKAKEKTKRLPIRSSPAVPDSERRRSGRAKVTEQSYMERDSDEDEEEMLEGVAQWDYGTASDDESGSSSDSDEGGSGSELSDAPSADEKDGQRKDEDGDEEMKDASEDEESEGEKEAPKPTPKKSTRGGRKKSLPPPAVKPTPVKSSRRSAAAAKAQESEAESDLSDAPDADAMDEDKEEPESEPEVALPRRGGRPTRGAAARKPSPPVTASPAKAKAKAKTVPKATAASKTKATTKGREKGKSAPVVEESDSSAVSVAPESEDEDEAVEEEKEEKEEEEEEVLPKKQGGRSAAKPPPPKSKPAPAPKTRAKRGAAAEETPEATRTTRATRASRR